MTAPVFVRVPEAVKFITVNSHVEVCVAAIDVFNRHAPEAHSRGTVRCRGGMAGLRAISRSLSKVGRFMQDVPTDLSFHLPCHERVLGHNCSILRLMGCRSEHLSAGFERITP
jgi:hypothetical protein